MTEPLATLTHNVLSFGRASKLTKRELEVLIQMASGKCSVNELAAALGISTYTVNSHLKGLFERTGVSSKAELLATLYADSTTRQAATQLFLRPPRVLVFERNERDQQELEDALEQHGLSVQRVSEPWGLSYESLLRMRLDVVIVDEKSVEGLLATSNAGLPLPGYVILGSKPRDLEAPGRLVFLERPATKERVVFAVLETSLTSPYDRSRLLRVPADVPAIVDGAFWARLIDLSYGGAFVELTHEHMRDVARTTVGHGLRIVFELASRTSVAAECTIVWRRERAEHGLPVGCGVRFERVVSSDLEQVHGFVRARKLEALRAAAETLPVRETARRRVAVR